MPWFWREPPPPPPPPPPIVSSPSQPELRPEPKSQRYLTPTTLLTTALLTTTLLTLSHFYRIHLSRILTSPSIPSSSLRTRSYYGRITSVGDADNFRLFHTPGGRLAGWHWLRRVPTGRVPAAQTLSVRIAGIDAPELAHFGKPAQPWGVEALGWLRAELEGRDVRVWPWRLDQYGRVVASVGVRRWGVPGLPRAWMRDVGGEMLGAGWATVYEARTGSEFGGLEDVYRNKEGSAKREGKGMWGGKHDGGLLDTIMGWFGKTSTTTELESPRHFKTRMAKLDEEASGKTKHVEETHKQKKGYQ